MAWESDSRRRAELPADWPKIRADQLKRDGGRCRWILPSKKRCPRHATEVDHFGDRFDHSKLRSLCTTHHARVTAQQGVKARQPRKKSRRPAERQPGRLR